MFGWKIIIIIIIIITGSMDDLISARMQAVTYSYLGTIADLWSNHRAREELMKNPHYQFKLYRNKLQKGKPHFTYMLFPN